MRDLLVLFITGGSVYYGFRRPWIGVLCLALFSYLNPHRFAWGFSRSIPVYLIIFLAVAAGMIFNGRDRQQFPWTRETLLIFILFLWFVLTTSLSPDIPYAAQDQLTKLFKIYLGILPTFWMINNKYKLKWLVVTIAFSFGFVGFKGGIWALGTGFSNRVYGPDNTFYGGNNEIGLALNMMLPLLLLCASEFKNKIIKNFFYAVFFFSICSIISTWSRGALLTLIAVLGAMFLSSKKKMWIVPVMLIGALMLAAVPSETKMSFLPAEWFTRMDTIQDYKEDASAMGRIDAWNYAISRAQKNPFTGGGFETFKLHGRDVHSAYFEILGEHGYIALIFWLSLLFGTMFALERLRSLATRVQGFLWIQKYARAVQISLLGYAVGGAFLGVAYWDIFYHLIALCVLMKVFLYRGIAEQQRTA